jgi:hypothetical protein
VQHEENLNEVEKLQGEKTTLEKEIAELQSGRRPLHLPTRPIKQEPQKPILTKANQKNQHTHRIRYGGWVAK